MVNNLTMPGKVSEQGGTYNVRRDDHSVMMRGAVANVRLDPWLFANHRLRVAGNGSSP
jgi:hypothetical protein